MGNARVARALYRGLLLFSEKSQGVPLPLKSSDVYACAPAARIMKDLDLQDASVTIKAIARSAFKGAKALQGEAASEAVERGLLALRLLNTEYSAALQLMHDTRRDKSSREGIRYELGTTFIHKQFGYRGLVYGWDRECMRDDDWIREANVDPRQPFYYVLPDEADCARLFNQPLSTRYVAQNNMLELRGERIVHRALNHFFSGYSAALGRYIPSLKLQYEYPGVYSSVKDEEGRNCVMVDSNLLLHPEQSDHDEEEAHGKGTRRRRRAGFKSVRRRGLSSSGGEREAII